MGLKPAGVCAYLAAANSNDAKVVNNIFHPRTQSPNANWAVLANDYMFEKIYVAESQVGSSHSQDSHI